MPASRNNTNNVVPKNKRPEDGSVTKDELLEDLSYLLTHDLEKTSSAMRMFFEIYKKETPTPKDLQRWSNTTERSWADPKKWLRWLLPVENTVEPPDYSDATEDLMQFAKDLDIVLLSENKLLIPASRNECADIFAALREFIRRTYSTYNAKLTLSRTPPGMLLILDDIEKRPDLLPGHKIARFIVEKKAALYGIELIEKKSQLALKFREV